MSRETVNHALKVLTDDTSVTAAVVFTAYIHGDQVDAKVGTEGAGLNDPVVRRTLAKSLRLIADKLDG